MPRKTSALLALLFFGSLYASVIEIYLTIQFRGSAAGLASQIFGSILASLAVPAILSIGAGLAGGAVKKGAFRPVFFRSFIILYLGNILFMTLIAIFPCC